MSNSAFKKSTITTPISVANGGTGKATVTSNSYLKGNGTGNLVERTYAEVRTDLNVADGATANTKASSAEINAVTDDAKFATSKAIGDSTISMWRTIPAASYTAAPASTSTITMSVDMTALILVGMSLRYTISSVEYFGIATAVASNLLTVGGAPLGGNVSSLQYGGGTVRQVVVIIPSTYEDASNTALIVSDLKSSLIWKLPKSYLVQYHVYSAVHDSHATHGQASVRINNVEVNTTAGGLTIAANATWYSTVIDIATGAYDINLGEAIEVTAVKGGTGDASDLTVMMIFVTP